jgi:hypothetical protein
VYDVVHFNIQNSLIDIRYFFVVKTRFSPPSVYFGFGMSAVHLSEISYLFDFSLLILSKIQ